MVVRQKLLYLYLCRKEESDSFQGRNLTLIFIASMYVFVYNKLKDSQTVSEVIMIQSQVDLEFQTYRSLLRNIREYSSQQTHKTKGRINQIQVSKMQQHLQTIKFCLVYLRNGLCYVCWYHHSKIRPLNFLYLVYVYLWTFRFSLYKKQVRQISQIEF